MTPLNLRRVLEQPNAWTLVYWLSHLLGDTESREYETEFGAPVAARLVVPDAASLTAGQSTLEGPGWTVSSLVDARGRARLNVTTTDEAGEAFAQEIRAILRYMRIPPPRDLNAAFLCLVSMESAMSLRRSIEALHERVGAPFDLDMFTEMVILMETQVARHLRICERMCNMNDDADASRLEAVEGAIDAILAGYSEKAGIAGISAKFQRDPRGATVIVGDFAETPSTVAVSAAGRDIRMVVNALREMFEAEGQPQVEVATAPVRKLPRKNAQGATGVRRGKEEKQPLQVVEAEVATDVLEVLRAGSWGDGGIYNLPPKQLERKLYERVAAAVIMAGGRWHSGKQGFAFKAGSAKFASMLAAGTVLDRRDYDFFWTPPDLADDVVREANLVPGMKVYEPSAGEGAIALAAARIVGKENVQCAELLAENVAVLRGHGFDVQEGDFLAMEPEPVYGAVLLNPPFARLSDIAHVEHAARFVDPQGVLVAIMSPSFRTNGAKKAQAFRDFLAHCGEVVREVEPGKFKQAGTNVATVMVRLHGSLIAEAFALRDTEAGASEYDASPRRAERQRA